MAKIYTTEVSDFCTNSYLVVGEGDAEAALIDPGDAADTLTAMIRRAGVTVKYLIATHCHLDHIGAAAEMARRLDLGLLAGGDDQFLLDRLDESCAMFGLSPVEKPEIARTLEDGMELPLGGSTLRFRSAPGHSPGSFVIFVDDKDVIVGSVQMNNPRTSEDWRAFIWKDGVMTDLNSLIDSHIGWVLRTAQEVNNDGWIVGRGEKSGERHLYLLIPN